MAAPPRPGDTVNGVVERRRRSSGCTKACDKQDFLNMDFPKGDKVPFPYEHPYPQQRDLMDTLLRSLELAASTNRANDEKKHQCPVYMLESPTGTGKSLSLACASLAWLRHMEELDTASNERRLAVDPTTMRKTASPTTTGLDWLDDWVPPEQRDADAAKERVRRQAVAAREALTMELALVRRKWHDGDESSERQRARRENCVRTAVAEAKRLNCKISKRKRRIAAPSFGQTPDMEYCLENYNSDDNDDEKKDDADSDEEQDNSKSTSNPLPVTLQAKQLINGAALDGSSAAGHQSKMAVGDVKPGTGVRKIIYAARTHSQLSQFVGELRRTAWGSMLRVAHLGGRKALCGNANVKRLPTEKAVTETCLDLQKGISVDGSTTITTTTTKKKRGAFGTTSGCPLLEEREYAVPTLALHLQAQPTDIEEASALGNASHSCAYYASRESVAAAEVVVLPYSMLLSKQTRETIGLSLTQAFVIVDEAHNLPEVLRSLHACRLSLPVVHAALEQLKSYTDKYADRLAGRNLFYLGQMRRILLALHKHFTAPPEKRRDDMMTATEWLVERKLDNINLFRILRYLERSRLPQKLLGFTNKIKKLNATVTVEAGDAQNDDVLSKHVSAMSVVQTFLEKLTFSDKEGKVVTDWPTAKIGGLNDLRSRQGQEHATIRYVLLHPAAFFENVLDEAHALALVGGTLRPFVHVAAELLGDQGTVLQEAAKADAMASTASTSQVSFSLVSPSFTAFTCDHVVPPSNVLLQCFARGPTGQTLDFRYQARSTNTVCDELGRTLVQICQTAPSGVVIFFPSYSYEALLVLRWKKTGLWHELQAFKKVHREPKCSQQVEASLQSYARDAIKGAVLLAVVGGKMSEGINFSNDMARCVIVIGLPYPDITDPELKEKMAALDESTKNLISGQAYYQNLCMRAVNQSVGRAIRHSNDYAAIILIDSRYTSDSRIWSGLSSWLKKGSAALRHKNLTVKQRLEAMKVFFATKT